jgi:hypothetical protein
MRILRTWYKLAVVLLLAVTMTSSIANHSAMADNSNVKHYIVVFTATQMADGT